MKTTEKHIQKGSSTPQLRNLEVIQKAVKVAEVKHGRMTDKQREKAWRDSAKFNHKALQDAISSVPANSALLVAECLEKAIKIISREIFELHVKAAKNL